jgi:hypothetical protein
MYVMYSVDAHMNKTVGIMRRQQRTWSLYCECARTAQSYQVMVWLCSGHNNWPCSNIWLLRTCWKLTLSSHEVHNCTWHGFWLGLSGVISLCFMVVAASNLAVRVFASMCTWGVAPKCVNHGPKAGFVMNLATVAHHLSKASRVSSSHLGVLRFQKAALTGSAAILVGIFVFPTIGVGGGTLFTSVDRG